MMTAPDESVVADVAPLVDQGVLMETDTDLPADMNAIDMVLIEHNPWLMLSLLLMLNRQPPSFLVMWTSIFKSD